MRNHNIPSANQEKEPTMRQYDFAEGPSGLVFEGEPGTVLDWEATNKWYDNPARRSSNTMIAVTESGNQYILGKGLIINTETGEALIIPKGADLPEIVIGEKWGVDGVFSTTPVQAVMAEYKVGAHNPENGESPFIAANEALEEKISKIDENPEFYPPYFR